MKSIVILLFLNFLLQSSAFSADDGISESSPITFPKWSEIQIQKNPIGYLEAIRIDDKDVTWKKSYSKQLCVLILQFYGIVDPERKRKMIPIKSNCDLLKMLTKHSKGFGPVGKDAVTNYIQLSELAANELTRTPSKD